MLLACPASYCYRIRAAGLKQAELVALGHVIGEGAAAVENRGGTSRVFRKY